MMVTVNDPTVTELPAVRFADAARRLGAVAHEAGLDVPAFRSPPRVAGADRTIRRYPAGSVVSVRIRGRAFDAVIADMVDGVLAANRITSGDASRMRARLVSGLDADGTPAEPPEAAPRAA
jgi:hypothetical protein